MKTKSDPPFARDIGAEDRSFRSFEEVWKLGSRVLPRYLRHFGLSAEDVEDVIQIVSVRLWRRWDYLKFESQAAAICYLKETTFSVAVRLSQGANRSELVSMHDEELGIAEIPGDRELIETVLDAKRMISHADACFLGPEPDHYALRMLCLAWILLDHHAPEDAHRVARLQFQAECPPHADDFLAWIFDPRVLRGLAMLQLTQCFELAWSSSNHAGIADAKEQVASRIHDFGCRAQSAMMRIQSCQDSGTHVARVLRGTALWKRFAFWLMPFGFTKSEYVQILEQPAKVWGYAVSEATVHGWIHNGRLIRQLTQYAAQIGQQEDPS